MRFFKLRLAGFKSFVEPAEFLIERGLTGVIGPNGCGKSNLVEAIRWVMGESSYKNMRASGMDDVIFSGSDSRPSRNTAEVTLFLDNSDRDAPVTFNDDDELQISRFIERESGSIYRVNGKEARARDVHLLFADASTGARSPSMIGQGRIGELISARPIARRALLEEAAGISGLYSRRHEAELRLRACEQNLEQLEDVTGQLESLERQARRARRYRKISSDIRKTEALLLYLEWMAANKAEVLASSHYNKSIVEIDRHDAAHEKAARKQMAVACKLPQLRDRQVEAMATLQYLTITHDQMNEKIRCDQERRYELEVRVKQLQGDIAREQKTEHDYAVILKTLNMEEDELLQQKSRISKEEDNIRKKLDAASHKLDESEQTLGKLARVIAEKTAKKNQSDENLQNLSQRNYHLNEEAESLQKQLHLILKQISECPDPKLHQADIEKLESKIQSAENAMKTAEHCAQISLKAENRSHSLLTIAQRQLEHIETEEKILSRTLDIEEQNLFPSIIDKVKVKPGFETALSVVLGTDLDISTDSSAPVYWSLTKNSNDDPQLPQSVQPLSRFVDGPPELDRRLAQIGVTDNVKGWRLSKSLYPGQALVTREGDLWRWDGYVSKADATNAAAKKLAQKNRLKELEHASDLVSKKVSEQEKKFNKLRIDSSQARAHEHKTRTARDDLHRQLFAAREKLTASKHTMEQLASRKYALEESLQRISHQIEECRNDIGKMQIAYEQETDLESLEEKFSTLRTRVDEERTHVSEIRACTQDMTREEQNCSHRLQEIVSERKNWKARMIDAQKQIVKLIQRYNEVHDELNETRETPEEVENHRKALVKQIEDGEIRQKTVTNNLASMEEEARQAEASVKQTLLVLSKSREQSGRAEERLNAAREKRNDIEARIIEKLNCQPHAVRKLAELPDNTDLPDILPIEQSLERLKNEREQIGAVNLQAEIEQREIREKHQSIMRERNDLIDAISRLRQGITNLNKEGRVRLLQAFDRVNEHFRHLFRQLFSGGKAALELVESDDPLEAGLEIMTQPPGKKPQTITLLSGGEQALTTLALIFAVFLTNPTPVCVLDEVDAPLDDNNVERFCDLMDEMAKNSETRFIIITHNPVTMARMNRLFGVTMAEGGVSQLVSVDLQSAEKMIEPV